MSARVTDNTRQAYADVGKQTNIFIRKAMDRVVKYSTPVTPKKTGDLRRNVGKTMSGKTGIIQWEMPYAIYQEKKRYRKYTTAGTGPFFAEKAVNKVVSETKLIARECFAE